MKIGQTSIIVYISSLLGSILGFLATLYFARALGAEVLGVYSVVIAVLAWLKLGGDLGVGNAIKKRISEGDEPGSYFVAGALSILTLGGILSLGLVLASPLLDLYIEEFSTYSEVSVIWFLIALLFVRLVYSILTSTLAGQRRVHITGVLAPVKIGVQSILQIALVVAGFSLVGMLVGFWLGIVIVATIGFLYLSPPISRPAVHHFRSLYDYAKYSWFGGIKSRTFNDVDILVLGAFVSANLVGVYAVAWSIARFLDLFSSAISESLFPEISHQSAQKSREAVVGIIEDGLAYSGLIVLPGLVGGAMLSDRLLQIYGPEFVQGSTILVLLILATLLYSYQKQLLNAVNALDRPDLAFRINLVFVALNVFLNVLLVWWIGWVGAAIATVLSVGVALYLSFVVLHNLVSIRVPWSAIGQQCIAALLMGAVIFGVLQIIEMTTVVQHNLIIVLSLVTFGGIVYFVSLLLISTHFRAVVDRNVPFDIPLVNRNKL